MKQKKQTAAQDLNRLFPPARKEDWRAAAEKLLKGASFDKVLLSPTYEGITLQPIYWPEDLAGAPHAGTLPGFPPFLRGSTVAGGRLKSWEIAQEVPAGTAADFNRALRHDLANGQSAVILPLGVEGAEGPDGGIPLATLPEWETALQGVPIEKIPLYVHPGSSAAAAAGMLAALCRKSGKSLNALRGCAGADPLGDLATAGALPLSLEQLYDETAGIYTWSIGEAPQFQVFDIRAEVYQHAGASAAQELGFAMATGAEYLRAMIRRNFSAEDIAPRIRFSFALGSQFFMEIAKLRAARVLWAQIVQAFGGSEKAQQMVLHTRTSRWNKTVYDPYVNMLRATTEAFSGIVGGSNSLEVGAFDEPLRPADEFSRRMARNIQIILKEESHLDRVIDPAGGSWYVETLTAELAEKAWALFQEIEKRGGMAAALKDNYPQTLAADTAQQRLEHLATRRDKLIGTNSYPNLQEKPLAAPGAAAATRVEQRETHPQKHRGHRDEPACRKALQALASAGPGNFIAAIAAAAGTGATIGEINAALRPEPGTETVEPLCLHRAAAMFEHFRQALEQHKADHGSGISVFLANMGPLREHKARADFSTAFFQVGGFEVIAPAGFDSVEAAVQAARESAAPIVVICSSDERYPEVAASLAGALKAEPPAPIVLLAGQPGAQEAAYRAAGIDDFIHLRSNVHQTLLNLAKTLGVLS